jgi:hypothetical protein
MMLELPVSDHVTIRMLEVAAYGPLVTTVVAPHHQLVASPSM